jgi:hypothetical protein
MVLEVVACGYEIYVRSFLLNTSKDDMADSRYV